MQVFYTNSSPREFQIGYLARSRQFRMGLGGKSSQYPVNAGFPQRSILSLTCFSLYIYDLSDDVICIIVVYVDDNTLYSKALDLWQQ